MGTWGTGIRQDDFVLDVIGDFEEFLRQGRSVAEATDAVRKRLGNAVDDLDDGPNFWIGLAEAQWKYGNVDPAIVRHVREDFHSGKSVARFEEEGMGARRNEVLEKSIQKIEITNQRPK